MAKEYQAALKRWKAAGQVTDKRKQNETTYLRRHFKTRIFATFPVLRELSIELGMTLTWDRFFQTPSDKTFCPCNWLTAADCPYRVYLQKIIAVSPKLDAVEQILGTLATTDCHGGSEKFIVMSYFPAVAFVVFLRLEELYGEDVVFINSNMSLKE